LNDQNTLSDVFVGVIDLYDAYMIKEQMNALNHITPPSSILFSQRDLPPWVSPFILRLCGVLWGMLP